MYAPVISINVRNVNQGLSAGLSHLSTAGVLEESRNGPVLVAPGPVCTTYTHPGERVLFSPTRNANPFFHLMEALWMLAGRNDLAWPAMFNRAFAGYSDDGETCWGAYGWRWRGFFGYDQLEMIVEELKSNPSSRRCVLSMWNAHAFVHDMAPAVDLPGGRCAADSHAAVSGGKDVPCNTHIYFDRRGEHGALNMTVCNRSNDIIWGAYGANAVHMSVLLEFLAAAIGCPVGVYRQMSNNFHMYTELYPHIVNRGNLHRLTVDVDIADHYTHRGMETMPLVNCGDTRAWMYDLESFMSDPMGDTTYHDEFFDKVAAPMYIAWHEWKAKSFTTALTAAQHIAAPDWRLACVEWIQRRMENANG